VGSEKEKTNKECLFFILSKLKMCLHISILSFTQLWRLGDSFFMPSFETFCERLTREKSKHSQNDVTPKSHVLIATPSKGKEKKNKNHKIKSSETSTTSSKEGKSKNEKPTCTFFKEIANSEKNCYKKEIHELKQLLNGHHISIFSSSSSSHSTSTKH
jgi:hypothetical protein